MLKIFNIRHRLMLFSGVMVTALMVFGGCPVYADPQGVVSGGTSSEALLEAEGKWNLVEESSTYDPALAHQQARDKVDPKNRKLNSALSPHFSPDAKSGQDGKMRVLKLQPESGADEDLGYEVAETSISKPARKVVVPELASKINALYQDRSSEAKVGVETVPAQPIKLSEEGAQGEVTQETDFFGKVAKLFSSDDEKTSEKSVSAVQSSGVKDVKKIQLLAPKPLRVDDIPQALAGNPSVAAEASAGDSPVVGHDKTASAVVVPRKLPARKVSRSVPITKTAVVLASEFAAQKTKSGAQDVMSVDVGQDGKVHFIGMRAAMHPSKTRIAFDFSGAVKYKVAIDHIRNVLRVKFDNTAWDQALQGVLDKNSVLLGSYVVRKQPDGSALFEVRLKKKSAIKDTMILRPGASPHHRVVIDLKS